MDTRYQVISSRALGDMSSAMYPFADAPEGTEMIYVTLRTAGVTVTFDGTLPTAGAVGHDFVADGNTPWVIFANQTDFKKVRLVQNGGTATGYVTFYGV